MELTDNIKGNITKWLNSITPQELWDLSIEHGFTEFFLDGNGDEIEDTETVPKPDIIKSEDLPIINKLGNVYQNNKDGE